MSSPTSADSQSSTPDPEPDPAEVARKLAETATGLLRELKKNAAAWQLPADISDRVKANRNDLFEAVEELRRRGYSVEFHPYFGFRLGDLPEHYVADEILDDLNTRYVGKSVHTFDTVGSTSGMAWDLAEKVEEKNRPAHDGAVIVAESQTRGRVKLGQAWDSPRGKGVYLSVLLWPSTTAATAEDIAYFSVAAALAVAHTLTDIVHIAAQIRWPNDVYVGARKIASVVCETHDELPGALVIGLGINTDLQPADLSEDLRDRATSIRMETDARFNHNRLVRYLLFYFDGLYQKLRRRRLRPVAAGLREYSAIARQEVLVTDTNGEHRGKVKDVDPARLVLSIGDDGDELEILHADVRELRIIH